MSLQLIFAFSREQIRKEPPILRCKEYVSSGGGVRRCLSITGIRLWILSVVDWDPKSKDSVEAKASPRIITASTCAFSIAWTEEMKINHYILDTKCCRSCKQKKVLNIEINMCVCVCVRPWTHILSRISSQSISSELPHGHHPQLNGWSETTKIKNVILVLFVTNFP